MTELEYAERQMRAGAKALTKLYAEHQMRAGAKALTKLIAAAPLPASVENKRRPKYGNTPTTDADGIKHASRKQAKRYRDLGHLMKAGEILMLAREVRFRLPGGVEYVADHVTANQRALEVMAALIESGDLVVEDVKSEATRKDKAYRIKAKQMRECLGIAVREV